MGLVTCIVLLLTHPLEFRTIVQFWLYRRRKRNIRALEEHPTSGWDRPSMRRCWELLDLTSSSFSAVIKELDGDLARTIALFYLVLRGLDTIEDDMTIPDAIKQPILRSFHIHTVTTGWKYDSSGPNEKDRQLLVEYDTVVEEFNRLSPKYKSIIIDIVQKMGTGMAGYAHKAATGTIYLETISEYDLYCHYAAGLVGEGLSRIFSASEKEEPWIGEQFQLSNSMGLLLQKTNIIRDYREDVDQQRYFWPCEIWGKKEYGFNEVKDLYDPAALKRAMWAQSEMVLDALRHVCDSLDYLRNLKNQSVFTFCAIPATMAIATLELCYMNPDMFQRNIKIRKTTAASLIMRSVNPREVGLIFRDYARKIHAKAIPTDPNFLRISVACGKIEQWLKINYPSFIQISSESGSTKVTLDPLNPRMRILQAEKSFNQQLAKKKRPEDLWNGVKESAVAETSIDGLVMYMAAFAVIIMFSATAVYFILKLSGERNEDLFNLNFSFWK